MADQERVNRLALDFPGSVATIAWSKPVHVSIGPLTGRVGEPFHARPVVRGGTPPYRFTLSRFDDRAGLHFDPETGEVAGTPTAPVDAPGVQWVVTDSLGVSDVTKPQRILVGV